MSSIKYQTTGSGDLAVYMEKKRVGTIRQTRKQSGLNSPEYRYYPTGSKQGGEPFSTIHAVKQSLTD